VWIALSADHGISPLPKVAANLRLPAANLSPDKLRAQLNNALSTQFSHPGEYVKALDYPVAWLNSDAFATIKLKENEAEQAAGDALKQAGLRAYYTRYKLERSDVPNTETGLKYLHSYSPLAAWYVLGVPPPYTVGSASGTDHASPYTYDTHVPLAFYGLPFQPGTYRTHAEPVDLATTLASLLGINAPTHAVGRVLTEAVTEPHRAVNSRHGIDRRQQSWPDARKGFEQSGTEADSYSALMYRRDENHDFPEANLTSKVRHGDQTIAGGSR